MRMSTDKHETWWLWIANIFISLDSKIDLWGPLKEMSLYLRDKINLSASTSLCRCSCLLSRVLCTIYVQLYSIKFIFLALFCSKVIVQLYRMYRKGVNYCNNRERKRVQECQGCEAETEQVIKHWTLLQIISDSDSWWHMTGWRPPSVWGWKTQSHGDECVPLSSQWQLPVIPLLWLIWGRPGSSPQLPFPASPGPGRQDAAQSTQQRIWAFHSSLLPAWQLNLLLVGAQSSKARRVAMLQNRAEHQCSWQWFQVTRPYSFVQVVCSQNIYYLLQSYITRQVLMTSLLNNVCIRKSVTTNKRHGRVEKR